MKILVTYILALLFCSQLLASKTEIEREMDIPPIKLTYADYQSILESLKQYLESVNAESEGEYNRESVRVSVSSGGNSVKFSDWPKLSKDQNLPNVALNTVFMYYYPDAPLSEVTIHLHDHSRSINISGKNSAQVKAISGLLRDEFHDKRVYLGGFGFRFFCAFVLMLIASILLCTTMKKGSGLEHLPRVLAVVLYTCILILPWEEWLPGTAIYSDSASFVDRNSNYISLGGVLLTVVMPLVMGMSKYFRDREPKT